MKSPLKELQSFERNSNHATLRSEKFNDEGLDMLFGDDFAKPAGRFLHNIAAEKVSELADVVAAQLQEWHVFASFDPINDTSMSSSAPLLRKRVNFATDENGQVLCTEYDSLMDTRMDAHETWYGASDFKQFRARCHETAAFAALDMDYRDYFHMLYSACSRGDTASIPIVDVEDAMEFAKYRGLERVIFRNVLQTDKITSIQGVVWTQNDAMLVSEEMLAETSRKLTVAARNMAQYLAASDSVIADQSPTDSERRFIEI